MSGFSISRILLLILAIVLVYVLLAYAIYTFVASHTLGANDFFSRWAGARALFLQGQDPYSVQVTQQIQIGMYGRLARPDEDQVAFAYPLYVAFFVLPLVSLPYAWAESLWIAMLILAVVGAGIALKDLFAWRFSLWGLLAFLLFILAFYPVVRGIFLGQFALLVYASFAVGLTLLNRQHDELAGWALAMSTVKPHVAFPVLAVILLWGLIHRRWSLLRGFISAAIVLALSAIMLLPNWQFEFIRAVIAYKSYIQIGSPLQVLCQIFLPSDDAIIGYAVLVVLLGSLLPFRFGRTMKYDLPDFLPTIELAMILATLGMIRTATTDQSILLIPWLHWLSNLARSGRRVQLGALGVIIVVLPWMIFLITLNGNQEAPIATTTVALLTAIAYPIVYWRSWIFRGVKLGA